MRLAPWIEFFFWKYYLKITFFNQQACQSPNPHFILWVVHKVTDNWVCTRCCGSIHQRCNRPVTHLEAFHLLPALTDHLSKISVLRLLCHILPDVQTGLFLKDLLTFLILFITFAFCTSRSYYSNSPSGSTLEHTQPPIKRIPDFSPWR